MKSLSIDLILMRRTVLATLTTRKCAYQAKWKSMIIFAVSFRCAYIEIEYLFYTLAIGCHASNYVSDLFLYVFTSHVCLALFCDQLCWLPWLAYAMFCSVILPCFLSLCPLTFKHQNSIWNLWHLINSTTDTYKSI